MVLTVSSTRQELFYCSITFILWSALQTVSCNNIFQTVKLHFNVFLFLLEAKTNKMISSFFFFT